MRSIKNFKVMRSVLVLMLFLKMNCVSAQNDTIRWFAHRGFLGLHPENTIEAMKRALHYKSVVLEMDISITKDKEVVISHDPFLNRKITLDSNGNILPEGSKLAIYQMPYSELVKYDVGSKPNPGFPEQIRYKAHIPRLADLLDSVEQYAKQQGLPKPSYFIETKLKPETDGKNHPFPEEFTQLLMDVIISKGIQDRVIIQSFDPRTLQVIRRKYPKIPVAFLTKAGTSLKSNLDWIGFTPDFISAKPDSITVEFMNQCKSLGISPIVGVFNGQEEFIRLKNLGVRGFIADYPLEYLEKQYAEAQQNK